MRRCPTSFSAQSGTTSLEYALSLLLILGTTVPAVLHSSQSLKFQFARISFDSSRQLQEDATVGGELSGNSDPSLGGGSISTMSDGDTIGNDGDSNGSESHTGDGTGEGENGEHGHSRDKNH